jgi:hypothetical protein
MLHVRFCSDRYAVILCSQLTVCSDAVAQRTLAGKSFMSASMNNTVCVQFCATLGFYYAGTEYGQECYCANSLRDGATEARDGDCNIACGGS